MNPAGRRIASVGFPATLPPFSAPESPAVVIPAG
jgi:hypothetical protein